MLFPSAASAVVTLCLAVFPACAGTSQTPSDAVTPDAVTPDAATSGTATPDTAAVVTLELTGCLSPCLSYTVQAYADGRVAFEGGERAARPGAAEWRVAPAVVAELVAAAEAAGHARATEAMAGANCATDQQALITTVRTAARTTQVWHRCSGFPGEAALLSFYAKIDCALGTAPYVGTARAGVVCAGVSFRTIGATPSPPAA